MKVLIIIPAYNSQHFIAKTIESILNQNIDTYIIVVDDCSTDNTYNIALSYPKVKVLRNRLNMGTYYSINHGLLHASQDISWTYYAIHGADDISHSDRFRKQLNILNNSNDNIMALGCRFNRVEFKTKRVIRTNPNTNESMLVIKREVFEKIGYFDNERAACDTEYKRRMLIAIPGCINNVDEILLDAYIHDNNLTKKIPLGGTFRKKYVNRFTKEHQEMKINKNFYKDFTL